MTVPISPCREKEVKRNEKFVRWQGITLAQFTLVIGVFATLSGAGLSAGLGMLQNQAFMGALKYRWPFAIAMVLLALTLLLCCLCIVSRLLDFRLTEQKTRDGFNSTKFGLNKDDYGNISWGTFWFAFAFFMTGCLLLVFSIGSAYWRPLLCA